MNRVLTTLRLHAPSKRFGILLLSLAGSVGILREVHAEVGAEPTAEQIRFFEAKVRPLLADNCYECHSGKSKKLKAGLYLDNRKDILRGGDSGPAVVPGEPDDSRLLSAVRYESFEMPPTGKLSDEQVEILTRWIADGAPWPHGVDNSARQREGFDLESRKRSHWSWQPLQSPVPPAVKNHSWPINEIDRFILARLDAADLPPAAAADRRQLIRRLYFDLIGLPPTPDEIRSFVDSREPLAYAELVDRLLNSEHFGEKWSRHWLDLVRYGETCGHEFDYPLPYAYRYRDYVIRAFNADVPYDQFLREHLAGDLLPTPRRHPQDGYNESIIGTGFWFLGEAVHAPTDVRADESDRVDNQIDVACKTFLGLTVACARCHDHKFDPIPTSDYYALAGFLQSSRRRDAMLDPRNRIADQARRLDKQRGNGDRMMHLAAFHDDRPTHSLAEYLLAALMAKRTGEALDSVAKSHGLPVERLKTLYDALTDDIVNQISHPLYAWRLLAWDAPGASAGFADARARLQAELERAQQAVAEAESRINWFHDFGTEGMNGWYATGEAFVDQPPRSARWDTQAERPRFASSTMADSGQRGRRLQGVLRSPTFELPHRRIHYRVNAAKAKIRLIIDSYVMDEFNALLFNDITLKNVSTDGRTKWVTQQRDLYHYVGHRAHLEIIDHGDGFAAVEKIGFSDGPPPPPPPHPLALRLLAGDSLASVEQLARSYQQQMALALEHVRTGKLDPAHTELLNWLLEAGMVTVDDNGLAEVAKEFRELDQQSPQPVYVMAMEDGDGEDERIHIRGSHLNLGDVVARRMPVAIGGDDQAEIATGSGRLELANRMTGPGNPFTPRVMVNRLWHYLMGRGIVPSVDDFGAMGLPPSHPELLDWLAQDFVANHWSVKHAVRTIVMSQTYRMSTSYGLAEVAEKDADNSLLHRARVRRLPAESIRDSMLAVAGNLNRTMYGPSMPVHLTSFMEGRGRPESGPLDGGGRRSVYIKVQRNFLSPMMLAFDMPSPFNTMGRRNLSNVPAQSLIMMNDPFVWQQAEKWAQNLVADESLSSDDRLTLAFEAGIGRPPSQRESQRIGRFLEEQTELHQCDLNDPRVWIDVCHAIMNLKEFIYLN